MGRMTVWVRWFFPITFLVSLLLIVWVILRPAAATRVDPLGSLILVLVTLVYAWFSFFVVQEMRAGNQINVQTIAEMREARKQGATPLIRAEHGTSSGSSHFFEVSNFGNSPAINLEVSLEGLPVTPGTTVARPVLKTVAVMVSGDRFKVEVDFSPYALSAVEKYGIVATYQNVLGENFEAVTEFPRAKPSVLPAPASGYGFTRSAAAE